MEKALVFHASREFHKSRLSTSSQTRVKFVKDKLEEKKNIPENKNTASTPSSSSTSSSIEWYLAIEAVTDAAIL